MLLSRPPKLLNKRKGRRHQEEADDISQASAKIEIRALKSKSLPHQST